MIKHQRGVGVVEIMIALAISLVILLAITRAYIAGSQTQSAQTDATRLNESARYAIGILSDAIKKAGFRNVWTGTASGLQEVCNEGKGVRIIEGKNDPITLNPAQTNVLLGGTGTAIANKSDALRVRYYGDSNPNPAPGVGDSWQQVRDCQGFELSPNTMTVDTFYVALDASNEPTLFCMTTNPNNPNGITVPPKPLPLVSGVESLQILYGEETNGPTNFYDRVVDHYVPWDLLTSTNNPDNILSVKISVVVRSPKDVATSSRTQAFNHFSSPAVTYPAATNNDNGAIFTPPVDRRLRQMFSSEVAVRNSHYPYCQWGI